MPAQLYTANVLFGANTTLPFVILANTVQDAAQLALRAYDQNAAITLANGDTRPANRLAASIPLNAVGSNNYFATVFIRDPSDPKLGSNSYQMNVSTVAIAPITVATYASSGSPVNIVAN